MNSPSAMPAVKVPVLVSKVALMMGPLALNGRKNMRLEMPYPIPSLGSKDSQN